MLTTISFRLFLFLLTLCSAIIFLIKVSKTASAAMRWWVLPLLLPHVVAAVELKDILRTPQFMLISQFNCETIFETYIQDQKCPVGLTAHSRFDYGRLLIFLVQA